MLQHVRVKALLADPGAFGSTYEREVNLSSVAWNERAERSSSGNTRFLAVAHSGEHFVGMAGAYEPDGHPTIRELYGMWVAPECRSAGVGSRLVHGAMRWSKQAGAEAMCLWVVEDNRNARGLYASIGFSETGLTRPHPSDRSLTEIRMSIQLAAG